MIRLNKYLKDQGYCSRREADRWIEEGLISINGKIITELGTKIDPEKDTITINKEEVEKKEQEKIYIMLNKPKGYVTTMKKTVLEKKIVTDLVDAEIRVYPVGRLDKDSTGMLILTNDGDLAYKLTHPSFEHEKEYEVTVQKNITGGQLDKLRAGIKLFGEKTKETKIQKISDTIFRIILTEGKNRQIRRICRKVGNPVIELKRVRIGKLEMTHLKEGEWKILFSHEVKQLGYTS